MFKSASGMITQLAVAWLVVMLFPMGWVVLRQIEAQAYVGILFTVLSYVYLGKVFYSFRNDLQKKVENRNFNLIGSWPWFILDVLILAVLLQLSIKSFSLQMSSQNYILQYSKYSQILLSLIFLFFRFVFQMLKN